MISTRTFAAPLTGFIILCFLAVSCSAPPTAQAPPPSPVPVTTTPVPSLARPTALAMSPSPIPLTSTPVPPVVEPGGLPTTAPLPSINILYNSGNERATAPVGNISFFQMGGRTRRPLVLGNNLINCWIPSPDGSKAFYVPRQFFSPLNDFVNLIDFQTGLVSQTVWRSTNRCMGLVWHPSGAVFLGSNYDTGQTELYWLGEETAFAAIGEIGPSAFSSDGKKLVILVGLEIHVYDVLFDAEGQAAGVRQDFTNLVLPLESRLFPMDFRLSPDDKKVALLNQRLERIHDQPNPTELTVFDLAAKTVVKVADSRELQPESAMDIQPKFSWSPDGSKIAFYAYTATESPGMAYYLSLPQVFVTQADGSGVVEITTGPGEVGEIVSWTPDGSKLIYVAGTERPSPRVEPAYQHDHLTLSNPNGSEKIVLPIQDFSVLEGPIIDPPFTLLPSNYEPTALLEEPIRLTCASGWTQLEPGMVAVVALGARNRVRSEPERGDNLIAQIPSGTLVKLLEGPVCADELVFWKVQSDAIPGGIGWTAEGDGADYFLQPSRP